MDRNLVHNPSGQGHTSETMATTNAQPDNDEFLLTEPTWQPPSLASSWVVASVNVNGLPMHAGIADKIKRIMSHLQLDVLALQETKRGKRHMEQLSGQLTFAGWHLLHSCKTDEDTTVQKGVAVVLLTCAKKHLLGSDHIGMPERAEEGQAGTGLRVRLAYANGMQLHIITFYSPLGQTNAATREQAH
ncbi:hypothetical protein GGF41_000192 [Coemansia sp. RSA 2531]|nr:hypothetical protein GGF41_000192 [Coemansia sp. RSA 2531]